MDAQRTTFPTSNGHGPAAVQGNGDADTGTASTARLALGRNRTLTVGYGNLVLSDPAAKKKPFRESSCILIAKDACGNSLIPLYNVLWAGLEGSQLVIDYAAQPSKTSIKLDRWAWDMDAPVQAHDTTPQKFVCSIMSGAYAEAQPRKRAYVLINPNAGPGGGLRKWENDVKPLFEAARIAFDVVVLSKGGEAVGLVERIHLDSYDTIVACSGDGTPHEIFNGLARRPDARKALSKIAVAHIPCGSGNAMSCNLYGSHRPAFAALAIAKGVVTSLDLISITQGDRRLVSFLSQSLGIVAESDLATEHLRWMGSKRFDFGILTRIFRKKCYPCDLAVKVEMDDKDRIRAHYRHHASEGSIPGAAKEDDDGAHGGKGAGLPHLKYGTVQDTLPEGWELVSYDKMGNFYCGNMAYMAPSVKFFSAAVAADGCMDLVTIDGDLSPVAATKTLMSVESSKFFDSPHVTYKKVSAYRIIPRNQHDGYISIDGERVPFEPFQAEVHRGLGRVISKRGVFETDGPSNWDSVTLAERLHA